MACAMLIVVFLYNWFGDIRLAVNLELIIADERQERVFVAIYDSFDFLRRPGYLHPEPHPNCSCVRHFVCFIC